MTPAVKTMPVLVATARWHLVLPDGRVRVCDTHAEVMDAAAADAPGSAVRFVGHTDPPTSPLRPVPERSPDLGSTFQPTGGETRCANPTAAQIRRPVAAGRCGPRTAAT